MGVIGLAVILAVGLTFAPLAAEAQQRTVPRVGVISAVTREEQASWADAFREGLKLLGYVEGRKAAIEWQYTDGKAERFSEVAAA